MTCMPENTTQRTLLRLLRRCTVDGAAADVEQFGELGSGLAPQWCSSAGVNLLGRAAGGFLPRMRIFCVIRMRARYALSRQTLAGLSEAGLAASGADPEVRAAFLLVNDLAVVILRTHLADVLGADPLSAAGMRRWGAEVLSIYQGGLTAAPTDKLDHEGRARQT